MNNLYVHYGSNEFINKDVSCYGITYSIKPACECLWASPIDTDLSWMNFCKSEYFKEDSLKQHFTFMLHSGAKICAINSMEDLLDLISRFPGNKMSEIESNIYSSPCSDIKLNRFPNYESISKIYDGIQVNISKDPRLYHLMYGWDVDSIAIWNLDVVEVVPKSIKVSLRDL